MTTAMGNGMVRAALGDLDARLDHWKGTLVDLCRIPSISAAGFPPEEVRRSAQAVAQALRDAGWRTSRCWRFLACIPTSTGTGCTARARPPCSSTAITT